MLRSRLNQVPINHSYKKRNVIRTNSVATSSKVASPRTSKHDKAAETPVTPAAFDLLHVSDLDVSKFQGYDAGAEGLQRLQEMSAKLLSSLEGLNNLDVLELPAFPTAPSGTRAGLDLEARRNKRASAREARKAATAASGPTESSTTSISQETSIFEKKMELEQLIKKTDESTALLTKTVEAPASVSLSVMQRSMGRTDFMQAGPSLSLPGNNMEFQAQPSSHAKEVNAKRAKLSGRKVVARGVLEGMKRKSSRSTETSTDGTAQFMKQAASVDLLNGVSEKELTTIVKDLLFLEGVKKSMRSILKRNPSTAEWARAVSMDPEIFSERLLAGEHAKAMMLKANYRLVISICKKYQNKGIGLQDLITEGMNGLMKGVEKFDPTKGFRFSTYAHWWIRQAITRSLQDESRTVRLPAHILEILTRITSAKAELTTQLGVEPSMAQLSARLQLSPQKIREVLDMVKPSSSLDSAVGGEDEGMDSMKDLIEDPRSTPDEVLEEVMMRQDLSSILSDLSEREAYIMRLRFGIDGEQETTLEDIGAMVGLTRERIRQIEAKALRKLRLKQKEAASILKDYSEVDQRFELAERSSSGTKKSK
ncbi:hypothetical protein CEUSTIGMA_g2915.t1 [Chlamydomonas eustigma]|uniref:RNA polymerase sigma-70 domain-containing protein n=1 Tax=Chlamydomonas eustigma TaxID=1157962 RepID=A0A250WXY0_9CHLO|nr:hypothetical protein CEUSTIGMA_g2915.t1 [Chlamydomonas eustigma]|eukprot:GAX75472.1 hypothetical protein CEUSTIGMA_g2915.t1 [Chlamydomonas eustigma]